MERKMPEISIILPIYNVENYLERCLNSIKDQTFKDFEVLCINDGSPDNSQAIVERFVAMDSRFKTFIKPNGGLSDARNYGLARATSKYVMFIDSDDFVELDVLSEVYHKAESLALDIVIFDFYQLYVIDNTRKIIANDFDQELIYTLEEKPELLCYVNNAAWNKFYRRTLFSDNKIQYPVGYHQEDLGTTPKLLYLAKSIGFVNKPLYNYLVDRPNNITQQYDKKIYHIIDMNIEYLEFYKQNDVFVKYYEPLKYLCVVNMLNSMKKIDKFTDYQFVKKFINDSYKFIKYYFPDFPAAIYELKKEKQDFIYLNRVLLTLYIEFRRLRGKLK